MNKCEKKTKQLVLRVTEQEHQELSRLAKENNVTMTTYVLNQCLSKNSGIYGKEFYDTIMRLNRLIECLDAAPEENQKSIKSLTQEVHILWQHLK